MSKKRIQLTLFLERGASDQIEKIREKFNPQQFHLIKSHITLCREDELTELPKVLAKLKSETYSSLQLNLSSPIRFSNGKGVLIPVNDPQHVFQKLRRNVLSAVIESPRIHKPHITLMHPRNSTCTDQIFEEISSKPIPQTVQLKKISLIEQRIGERWNVLESFHLG